MLALMLCAALDGTDGTNNAGRQTEVNLLQDVLNFFYI
jgi:hypothetical protein